VHYINTGNMGAPHVETLPYSPLTMEMIAKNMEANGGWKK
jgi:hypothetical protein